MPNGNLGISTRRGDVFIVENPTSPRPFFRKFASGLHEILGLAYKDGHLYCAQRGELTRLVDSNMDGKADIYETVYAWPVSGHYHEYSFGPVIAPDGKFFVSGNVAFGNEEWWRGEPRCRRSDSGPWPVGPGWCAPRKPPRPRRPRTRSHPGGDFTFAGSSEAPARCSLTASELISHLFRGTRSHFTK